MFETAFEDDLGARIRRARIFNPDVTGGPESIELSPGTNDVDPTKMFEELYRPDNQATNRLNELLSKMPRRGNPSTWRKIAAAASAFGGGDNVDKVLYSGYNRDMADWKTELEPAMKSAELERGNNINLRNMANNVVTQRMADARLERQLGRDRVLERQGDRAGDQRDRTGNQRDTSLEYQRRRVEILEAIQKGGKLEVDDNGNARLRHPDGTVDDTVGDYLSFKEKRDAIEKAKADNPSGSNRDRYRTDVIDDPDNPGRRIAVRINLDTNEMEPVNYRRQGAPKTEKPRTASPVSRTPESSASRELGVERGVRNRFNLVKNSNPQWAKWLTLDKQGNPVITRPSIAGRFLGTTPDEETFKKISRAIFGTDTGSPATVTPGNTGNSPFPPTVRADGKVPVRRKRDGKTGWATPPVSDEYEELK